MTDKEIIKALECCNTAKTEHHCDICPFYEYEKCTVSMLDSAVDLINRQKSDIETLKEQRANLIRSNTALSNEVLEVINEGIKDFAERLKKRCVFSQSNLKGYKMRVIDTESIDELVKEMTEGGVNYE